VKAQGRRLNEEPRQSRERQDEPYHSQQNRLFLVFHVKILPFRKMYMFIPLKRLKPLVIFLPNHGR
jgi:hypothetical protein